jgi:hypothetical protein
MADNSSVIAQNIATNVLQQWNALQNGVLNEQVDNPTDYIVKRPWIDEPDGSLPFDPQNGIAIGLPPLPAATQVVLSMPVPVGYDGVIKYLSCNTAFPFNDFSGDLVWQLRQNGRPIRNFDNILAQKGTTGIPRPISPIRIYSGDLIEWVVTHVANVGLNGFVICSLNGYFYPIQGNS